MESVKDDETTEELNAETDEADEKKNTKKQATTASCNTCDDCTDFLEQSFACLFGYKKPRQKYIENHSVITIEYTLENCVHLYECFKPELPEYDDIQKFSVPAEVIILFIQF